jgi:hypothetical protein
MPFQSEAQRRFMWAKHPGIARRWTDRYGTGMPYKQLSGGVKRGKDQRRPGYRPGGGISKGPAGPGKGVMVNTGTGGARGRGEADIPAGNRGRDKRIAARQGRYAGGLRRRRLPKSQRPGAEDDTMRMSRRGRSGGFKWQYGPMHAEMPGMQVHKGRPRRGMPSLGQTSNSPRAAAGSSSVKVGSGPKMVRRRPRRRYS